MSEVIKIHCDDCDVDILPSRLDRHNKSKKHIKNTDIDHSVSKLMYRTDWDPSKATKLEHLEVDRLFRAPISRTKK